MADFTIPTLTALMNKVRRDLGAEDQSALQRSDADVFGRALAGALYGLYGYAQNRAANILPGTCDEDTLLNQWGPFYLGSAPDTAVASVGPVRFTGNANAAVAAGTELQRSDGELFTVTVGGSVATAGYVDLAVSASTAGADGDTAADTWLTLTSSLEGIDSTAQVQSDGLTGGTDAETTESYRARVMAVREAGAQTGRTVDWENWAMEVSGVTRAWAAPNLMGVGTITVFIMRDNDSAPYPAAAECAAVLAHLQATGTPFGEIYVTPPQKKAIDMTLRVTPNTDAVRTAVKAALKQAIDEAASPVERDSNDRTVLPAAPVTILRSHLTEAISGAAGETDHLLSEPAADIECAIGELAELGDIVWM